MNSKLINSVETLKTMQNIFDPNLKRSEKTDVEDTLQ